MIAILFNKLMTRLPLACMYIALVGDCKGRDFSSYKERKVVVANGTIATKKRPSILNYDKNIDIYIH